MLGKLNCCVVKAFVFLIAPALIAGMVGCVYNPPRVRKLEIRTWYDLDAVRNNLAGNYILMNDLDSATLGYDELASPIANGGSGWQPIGHGNWVWTWFGAKVAGQIFRGTFDGQGHEIRDLYINRQEEEQVGLFGLVAKGEIIAKEAIIKNVSLINATVTAGEAGGEPLGLDEEAVRSLAVAPDPWGLGGLVGYNGGIVSNCHATGNATSESGMGGLVRHNGGTVSNCSFTGTITGDGWVGGLAGQNDGTIGNCYFVGNVTGNGDVGGLVGVNYDGTVSDSFWDTETSGQATSDGGTGKNTPEMKSIVTFSGAGWNIIAVANPGTRKPYYIWNIVGGVTYPFLGWQPV